MAAPPSTSGGVYTSAVQPVEMRRVPPPPYRHAAPSAPWPWIDIHDLIDQDQLRSGAPPVPEDCDHKSCQGHCWRNYPQSRFPNWTPGQVKKCKIRAAIKDYDRRLPCRIYLMDVTQNGIFENAGILDMIDEEASIDKQWDWFKDHKQKPGIRVRALFVENMSGPVLQMLGGKYNIEPFFFSSSLNWIPSRFQEDPRDSMGDHITVTLPFIQSLPGKLVPKVSHVIDVHAPLRLKFKRTRRDGSGGFLPKESALVLDLLSVHLIRNVNGNTIISYHANMDLPTTKAGYLHERIRFAGQSVYWQKMLETAEDPTFLLLIFIWQAAYAWDEALQQLNEYIVQLEAEVLRTSSLELTQELHVIRAHHLHYSSLLQSFQKAVVFVKKTTNPALTEAQRAICDSLVERECSMLEKEVERLETTRFSQEQRLKNVMNLVFSSVNINDSRAMKRMTEAAVRDSAVPTAMRQISYLSMIFLPASYANGIFGMNVGMISPGSLGTITHYSVITVALTVPSLWLIIALESSYMFRNQVSFWTRLCWPYFLLQFWYRRSRGRREAANGSDPPSTKLSPTPYFGVIY
ncbi:hypothetical protein APHAL10511_007242 [Amanita phalloides]|nr:hypothetical protein APHAL10511_007242 [Amanita phalloides]